MPRPRKLSHEILEAALLGLEAQRQRIDDQIAEVRQTLLPAGVTTKTRGFSAATRAKMAAAQKDRWAKAKTATAGESSRKRRMSAAGRKAIAMAAKRRWAEFRKRGGEKQAAPRSVSAKTAG
ncbi:MAG TPA: hypothetical protein VN893_03840 [Bryobacteraceae bacterium]|nr:hypothetical protein [Bryobacteraceae bacterium]